MYEHAAQWRSHSLYSVSGFEVGSRLWLPVTFLIPLGPRFLELPYTYPTSMPTTVYLYASLIKPIKRKKDSKFKK